MILPKEKINRYLRHIILPEISGEGQKKIIEASVLIYAPEIEAASSLIYYLAASGTGSIQCCLKNTEGFDELYRNIKEIDNDIELKLYSFESFDKPSLIVFICDYDDINDAVRFMKSTINKNDGFVPLVAAVTKNWRGYIQIFNDEAELHDIILKSSTKFDKNKIEEDKMGSILSNCLIGALTAIEAIKIFINYKNIPKEPLYFDLLKMEFSNLNDKNFWTAVTEIDKDVVLTTSNKENYIKDLKDSRVLVVGTGGLGSSAAYALAKTGVGTIGLVDFDIVELSNLSRQIIHSSTSIGILKVESAKKFINKLNPDVKVETINARLGLENALDIVNKYDIIVDAVDNIQTRYLLNDACYFADKPLVDGASIRFYGVIMTIIPKVSPCYRCVFDVSEKSDIMMTCSEAGVLGPVPGAMGFIQAAEVIKLLIGEGDPMVNRITYFDALYSDFETLKIEKNTECKLCGNTPKISSLSEYQILCSREANAIDCVEK